MTRRPHDEILDGHEYSVSSLFEERRIAVGQRLHQFLMKVRFAIWNGRNGYKYAPSPADWRAAGFDLNSSFTRGC